MKILNLYACSRTSRQAPVYPIRGGEGMSRLDVAIFDLNMALHEQGIKLEHIKVDVLPRDGDKQVKSIGGVELKEVIYEDEATHWRHTPTSRTVQGAV